jgi:hypothetical protein
MVVQDSDDSAIVSSWVKRQSQLPSLRVLDAGIQGNGVSTCDLGPPGEADHSTSNKTTAAEEIAALTYNPGPSGETNQLGKTSAAEEIATLTDGPGPLGETDQSTNKRTNVEDMTSAEDPHASTTRLCTEQRGTTARLGVLPDGRRLTWFQSDPKAVYVTYDNRSDSKTNQDIFEQADNQAQVRYLNAIESDSARRQISTPGLRPCKRGTLCCIWGCSVEVPGQRGNRECLTFSSPLELVEHLNSWHLFAADPSHSRTTNLRKGGLDRITEGEALRHLCSCITSAACARDPTLVFLRNFVRVL